MEDVDILSVIWSDAALHNADELQLSIDKVIETIENYKCRKLLIDATAAQLLMNNAILRDALTAFAVKLSKTGVEKVARIITSDQTREERVESIRNEIAFPFKIYDISNREQALHWLKED
jgi:hypothetical protein